MKYLTTTTIALLLTAPMATAQMGDQGGPDNGDGAASMDMDLGLEMSEGAGTSAMSDPAQLIRTRDITGGAVFTMDMADDEGFESDFVHDGIASDWTLIGTVEDLVLNRGGEVVGIVAEVGGFLDLGDKHVMLETDDMNLVAVDDTHYTFVTRQNEEELENLEGIDEGFWN
jgi:hypothetical protein